LRTDGDVVENDENTKREIDLLVEATGIDMGDRILDLCCGQGRHSLELARRGFREVTGLDRSRYLVRLARRRAAKSGFSVAFHEGDARKFRLANGTFDSVFLMGNSFGYFDSQDDDRAVLKRVQQALRAGGRIALDLTDGEWIRENFERRSWEWIDNVHFVCRERSLSADGERLVTREVVTHSERGVIADQFYAERLYSSATITALLEREGFLIARMHGSLGAASDRNQDLGMMAARLFFTAVAPAKQTTAVRHKRTPKRVSVLLGDPRLPDSVKRDGQFNAEDIETVQRLKAALAQLSDYAFSYHDNHLSLGADLRSSAPDFVLNLCDEGFNNDAFKELHIPAMLEMHGIHYTGAGPACLGACYDKSLVRAVATTLDVPTPEETFVSADDQSATIPSIFPAILKPNFGDSSIGITQEAVVHDPSALVQYLRELRSSVTAGPVLIQEFLTGPEYSVALIGNPGYELRALPILTVDYSKLDPALPKILGYESKWLPDSPYWTDIAYHEARLSSDVERELVDHSRRLFERLHCRDYARFDFRADATGKIKLLEVNPNPGWCWDGKFNLMAEYAGISYSTLLGMILNAADSRISSSAVASGPASKAA